MKISCVNLKPLKILTVLALVCVMLICFMVSSKSQSVYFGYAMRQVPIYSVNTNEKRVAISFDAAWGADKTSEIIKICKDHNIKATFFLVGFWVESYPEKVKEIYDAGFDIGTHSNTHPQMSKLTSTQITEELTTSCNLISKITGEKVRFFRPPYGDYNDLLIQTAKNLGLQTIQWSVDSLDWKGLSAGQILTRITTGVSAGAIILCHNNADHIVEALPQIIENLTNQGYRFVKMSELVYESDYTIDNNGMQTKN